eukprot:3245878-Pleurochrysis_carterae.AAC.1
MAVRMGQDQEPCPHSVQALSCRQGHHRTGRVGPVGVCHDRSLERDEWSRFNREGKTPNPFPPASTLRTLAKFTVLL